MLIAIIAIIVGLLVLVWSAERFMVGASGAASHANVDLALENAIGSNIVNTGLIRDRLVMIIPTHALLIMAYGFIRQGRINRVEGTVILCSYVAYTAYLVSTTTTIL
jgi:cation:H+ antiporter